MKWTMERRRSRPLKRLGLKFELQLHVAHVPSKQKHLSARQWKPRLCYRRIDYFVGRRGETGMGFRPHPNYGSPAPYEKSLLSL